MKNIICFETLAGIMLLISSMTGCGSAEDEPKNVVTESPATQAVVEQKADMPVENHGTVSQNTEPANVVEIQHAAREIKKDLASKSNVDVPQKAESIKAAETQTAVQDVPEVIVIENKVYASDKKGPVTFNHVKHNKEYKISCTQCHHLYQDGKNLWKEGDHVDECVVCHDPAEEKDKAVKLQNAFHQNCRDCHKEVSKEGKEAPYTKCADCHG